MLGRVAVLMMLLLASANAGAHEFVAGALTIQHPWSRATAPGMSVGAGYMTIVNRGTKGDVLLSVSTPRATRVEMHRTSMDQGMMRMRPVDAVPIPASATVKFEPAGLHLMLVGLSAPLAAGSRLPLTLRFRRAGEVRIELAVEALGAE